MPVLERKNCVANAWNKTCEKSKTGYLNNFHCIKKEYYSTSSSWQLSNRSLMLVKAFKRRAKWKCSTSNSKWCNKKTTSYCSCVPPHHPPHLAKNQLMYKKYKLQNLESFGFSAYVCSNVGKSQNWYRKKLLETQVFHFQFSIWSSTNYKLHSVVP